MSNTSEPFAKVEKFGEMYELHIGNGRMHNKDRRKTIVDCWADAINDDFEERCAAREREAAAKAMEEAAERYEAHLRDTIPVLRIRGDEWLRARAAATREGKA